MSGQKRQDGQNPFSLMDRDEDGKLSKSEFKGPARAFSAIDTDKDDFLSRREMYEFRRKRMGNTGSNYGGKKYANGGAYPDLTVIKYDKSKAWPGNVIFVDKGRNKIVEASLDGKIVWECDGPTLNTCSRMHKSCGAFLTDVELLPNNNILVLCGGQGVYEINRDGKVVWSYQNNNVSHDADRLENGNTIMACVGAEKNSEFPYSDPQAIEVDKNGKIVWAWYAKNEFAESKYKDVRSRDANDWTHMNSVQRLKDGHTLLSVRNWNLMIAVDKNGKSVWKTGAKRLPPTKRWGRESPSCPHTPVLLDNGNIIVSEPIKGRVIEWSPEKEKVVWSYPVKNWRQGGPYYFIRAAHRLPNKNTFIIDSKGQFLEVTPEGEIVWQAKTPDCMESDRPLQKEDVPRAPCFNADRRGLPYYGGR